jgi:hypothetical protein
MDVMGIYLTLCTIPLKLKKVAFLIQDVVHITCDKKNGATLHEIFSADLLCRDVISSECGGNTLIKSNINKATV